MTICLPANLIVYANGDTEHWPVVLRRSSLAISLGSILACA